MITIEPKAHHSNAGAEGYQEQISSFISNAPETVARQVVDLLQSQSAETRWLAARSIGAELGPFGQNGGATFLKMAAGAVEPLMFAVVHETHLTVQLEACAALERLGFDLHALSDAYKTDSGLNSNDYEVQSSNRKLEIELATKISEELAGNLRYHSIHSMELLQLPKSA